MMIYLNAELCLKTRCSGRPGYWHFCPSSFKASFEVSGDLNDEAFGGSKFALLLYFIVSQGPTKAISLDTGYIISVQAT
jgi:hypothetical protein